MLSSKRQKRTMIGMTVCMIPVAVAIVLTLTHEKACFAASAPSVENYTVETEEEPKRADFDDLSAMPCDNPEAFKKWLATYEEETDEQKTGEKEIEKEIQETIWSDAGETGGGDLQSAQPGANRTIYGCGVEDGRSIDGGDRGNDRDPEGARIYLIAGKLIDPEIQRKLYRALEAEGIGYWYTGALCQMWQESQGRPEVVNPNNGIDCGLYQYRITYWTEPEDIFDVDAQLRRYASDMAARFNSGLTVDEAISRHNTSDSVAAVNWEYVGQVKQWLGQMEVIE